MTRSRSIPAELHAPLLAWLDGAHPDGRPRTQADAAAWLASEHNVRVSRMAVTRLVASHSKRGEAIIVEALRERFVDAVGPLRARVTRMAAEVEEAAKAEPDTMKKAVALRAVTGALDTFAKVAGLAATKVDLTSNGKTLATAAVVILPPLDPDDDDAGPGALAAQPGRTNPLPGKPG